MTERTPERAYFDLQKLARDQGRNTQQLFELYIHERFLARLAESRFEPQRIDYPTLFGDRGFPLLGYPLESVIAEKADTMMFLGDANTRDRDYGDVYLLSQTHAIEADALRSALRRVVEQSGSRGAPTWPAPGNPSREPAAALGGVSRPRWPGRSAEPFRRCRRCGRQVRRRATRRRQLDLESSHAAVGVDSEHAPPIGRRLSISSPKATQTPGIHRQRPQPALYESPCNRANHPDRSEALKIVVSWVRFPPSPFRGPLHIGGFRRRSTELPIRRFRAWSPFWSPRPVVWPTSGAAGCPTRSRRGRRSSPTGRYPRRECPAPVCNLSSFGGPRRRCSRPRQGTADRSAVSRQVGRRGFCRWMSSVRARVGSRGDLTPTTSASPILTPTAPHRWKPGVTLPLGGSRRPRQARSRRRDSPGRLSGRSIGSRPSRTRATTSNTLV